MALTEYTIKITNQNTNPKVLTDTLDLTTISPTGITTPQTPYEEYIADMATVGDGSITFELYDKFQFFKLAASSILTITTDNGDEALYYKGLNLDGALIEISNDPVQTIAITLNSYAISPVASGDAVTLTATTVPASGTVTWTSSDTAVATVSAATGASITVSGVAAGTAIITATTVINGVTAIATCRATVTAE